MASAHCRGLGGVAGTQLSRGLGGAVSCRTLLRVLRRLPVPSLATPTALGVDDFAMPKRQTYGTVLIDLERHRPVALLPDCTAETLVRWLQEHPGAARSPDRHLSWARTAE
jgi:transposase